MDVTPLTAAFGARIDGIDLSAPPDNPTMDALRGNECKLLKAIQGDEEVPKECLFWQPIIEAGAG